jgi:hypothetical protein
MWRNASDRMLDAVSSGYPRIVKDRIQWLLMLSVLVSGNYRISKLGDSIR